MDTFGKEYHLWMFAESVSQSVSQSVFYKVLNAARDNVLKRKCLFNREIPFHSAFKKDT